MQSIDGSLKKKAVFQDEGDIVKERNPLRDNWTAVQTACFVSQIPGLEGCATIFIKKEITGIALLRMTENNLCDIGLTEQEAKILIAEINALKSKPQLNINRHTLSVVTPSVTPSD